MRHRALGAPHTPQGARLPLLATLTTSGTGALSRAKHAEGQLEGGPVPTAERRGHRGGAGCQPSCSRGRSQLPHSPGVAVEEAAVPQALHPQAAVPHLAPGLSEPGLQAMPRGRGSWGAHRRAGGARVGGSATAPLGPQKLKVLGDVTATGPGSPPAAVEGEAAGPAAGTVPCGASKGQGRGPAGPGLRQGLVLFTSVRCRGWKTRPNDWV